jgi:hypothetical protein
MSADEKVEIHIGKLKVETLEDQTRKVKLHKQAYQPQHPHRTVLCGPSRSGKSNLLVSFLTKPELMLGYFDHIYIFSPSCYTDHVWEAVRNTYNEDEYTMLDALDPALIEELIEELKTNNKQRSLIILDDCITESAVEKSMVKLFIRGRHLGASIIVTTQSYMKVPRAARDQATNIFVFAPSNTEITRIVDEQLIAHVTKEQLESFIKHATKEPYDFFQIYKTGPRAKYYRKNLNSYFIIDK